MNGLGSGWPAIDFYVFLNLDLLSPSILSTCFPLFHTQHKPLFFCADTFMDWSRSWLNRYSDGPHVQLLGNVYPPFSLKSLYFKGILLPPLLFFLIGLTADFHFQVLLRMLTGMIVVIIDSSSSLKKGSPYIVKFINP